METLSFGQPLGAVMQVAYFVEDMDRALKHWTKMLRVGPFFLFEHFALLDAKYRGKPTDVDLTLALAFSGTMNLALIVQNNDAPSVYREVADRFAKRSEVQADWARWAVNVWAAAVSDP